VGIQNGHSSGVISRKEVVELQIFFEKEIEDLSNKHIIFRCKSVSSLKTKSWEPEDITKVMQVKFRNYNNF